MKKERDKPLIIADILTMIAFIIIFVTTIMLNVYVALYLLAFGLIVISYLIIRGR